MKQKTASFYWILLSALLLMAAALYNGFPLVTSDTGIYIASGFHCFVPNDRPIVYGLFVRHSSLNASLWFTIALQAILVSWMLWQVINKFSTALTNVEKFGIVVFISVLSSVAWFTGQIMPDIFTAIGVLAFLLLLFPQKSRMQAIFNSILLVLSCLVHNSNMIIFSMLAVALMGYGFFSKSFRRGSLSFRKSAAVFLLIFSSWIIAPAINYAVDGNFRLAGSPHVFLLAKNVENGILDKYLDKNCGRYLMKTMPDTGTFIIAAKHSKLVMDVEAISKADNARVHMWTYLAQPNQQFRITKVKDRWYSIVSVNSGKCLQTLNDSLNSGLVQSWFTGADNELFEFKHTSDPLYFNIVNKQNGKIASVFSDTIKDGAALTELDSATDHQQFLVVRSGHCLCMYQDELPNSAIDFLWGDHSVFSRSGAWMGSKEEYSNTLHEIYFSKDYFGANLGEALMATLQQLTHNDIGDGIGAYDTKSAPYLVIKENLPYELKSFIRCKENGWQLNFTEINKRNFWLLIFSTAIILFFFQNKMLRRSISSEFSLFIKFCLLAIIINAFVTGAMANVLDRLQSRVSWCIPFIAVILMANAFFPGLKKRLKTAFSKE